MNRRTFLQNLAAGSCGLALTRAGVAAPAFHLRYMVASSMYGNLPLASILPEVKKTGASMLDLWPKPHGTQREEIDALGHDKFAAMLQEHGLTLGCITRYDLGPFRLGDELAVAKKFGAKLLVTGATGNAKLTGAELKTEVKSFVEKMQPHSAQAAEQGMVIAIENHAGTIAYTPDSLRWLAEFAGPGLGVALAPYHLPQDPAELAQLLRDVAPKLSIFYAWEYGMGCMKPMPKDEELQQLPGRGKLDFKPLLTALAEVQFTGPTEIFMHPTPRGIPILPTAEQVTAEMARSRAYLDSLTA